tara:strand:+ start:137 stop:673 length:537 start_codon:yes stop_codon:yes gene_type:complete
MIDLILNIDQAILIFINQTLSNSLFDFLMPLFDDVKNWIPFILALWIYLSYRDKENRLRLLILIPLVIIIGDQLGRYIKHMEFRDRPWFALGDLVNHLGGNGGKHYSFPSNHALNTAASMAVFSSLYKNYSKYFWMYLFIIMFSRVYIGVHYPLDVLSGAVLGVLIGFGCFRLIKKIT